MSEPKTRLEETHIMLWERKKSLGFGEADYLAIISDTLAMILDEQRGLPKPSCPSVSKTKGLPCDEPRGHAGLHSNYTDPVGHVGVKWGGD